MALPEDGDHQDMGGACPSGTTLGPSATTPDVSPLRIGARTTQSHPHVSALTSDCALAR